MSIQSQSDLQSLGKTILKQFAKYKIKTTNRYNFTHDNTTSFETNDEKEGLNTGKKWEWKESMCEDVMAMQQSINLKGTDIETKLFAFEKSLISKEAKSHITRKCHHRNCKNVAPSTYPNNLYLCDYHKKPLRKQLESYQIPLNKGNAQERKKCKKLKYHHQKIIDALKIPDSQQSFGNNQHKYPPNYFVVCMSKLLLCQQELSKTLPSSADNTLRKSSGTMKKIVEKLIEVLMTTRQNLNCHWCDVVGLIISVCEMIGGGVAWLAVNVSLIAILWAFLGVIFGVIVVGFIYGVMTGNRDAAFVAGAAGVATGVGLGVGTIWGATESGAVFGTMVGGPAGTLIGGVVGFLIGGGLAAMYKFG
eukprot:991748_1